MAAIVFIAFAAHVVAWIALPQTARVARQEVAPTLTGAIATA